MAVGTSTDHLMSLDNPVLRAFFFYSSILVVKMMVMSILTAMKRFKHKAFANPEDAAGLRVKPKVDDNVERVRRAHLNDLENITLFFVIGYIYALTNPNVALAKMLYRVYTLARILHTLVYAIVVVRQPARVTVWTVAYGITGYMAFQSILAHLNDLENITLFFVIGYIYALTNPSVAFAKLLYQVYTLARILHTLVYAVVVIPQPARAISWFVGYGITGYMAFQSILHFML